MKAWWTKLMEWLGFVAKEKAKELTPVAEAKPKPEEKRDEWAVAVKHTCPKEVGDWLIVSTLTVRRSGSKLWFNTDKPEVWPNIDGCIGDLHCLVFRDGDWHTGPADGVRPFKPNVGTERSAKGVCVPNGDERLYIPRSGEKWGFVVSGQCRRGQRMKPKQRTTIAWMVWE